MDAARFAMLLLLSLILVAAAHAQSGHITLLTVADEGTLRGGTADLYLVVRPGNGAIFIDSFPLTRVDTQASVRYANKIACDMLQVDCGRYDFFYTIRANSAIVGGPSAGAAITVLTVAVLDNEPLDQETAMTGTINSGGIIGPVAGVTAKVSGARSAGISKVLIPALTSPDNTSNATNVSMPDQLPLQNGVDATLSDDRVTVVRVSTVEEALYEFTGKDYRKELPDLVVPQEYAERMGGISAEICDRSAELETDVAAMGRVYNDTNNYTQRIEHVNGNPYSRASLCFSKNIELARLLLQNTSNTTRHDLYRALRVQVQELDTQTRERSIETIGDLETYAIVMERVREAQQLLDTVDALNPDGDSLAYAQERLLSAHSWSTFFGMDSTPVQLDPLYLQRACLSKISEAEERISYVELYAPQAVLESHTLLEEAKRLAAVEPILCIFTASKSKAQANLLANAISVDRASVDALVQQKLDADLFILKKQQDKGFFPILGYSYMQYASDLRKDNPYSALTFSEYALELSNLDIYFPREERFYIPPHVLEGLILFSLGAVFGAGVAIFFLGKYAMRKRRS
jgi:uncharacterized protein